MVRLRVAAVIVAVLTANTAVQAQNDVGGPYRGDWPEIRTRIARPAQANHSHRGDRLI